MQTRHLGKSRTTRMNKATEKAPDRTEAQSSQKRHNSKQSTLRMKPSGMGILEIRHGSAIWFSPLPCTGTRGVRSGLVKETELAESKPSRKISNVFLCLATISLLHTVTQAGRMQEHLNCCETSLFNLASECESNRKVLTRMNEKKKEGHNESAL